MPAKTTVTTPEKPLLKIKKGDLVRWENEHNTSIGIVSDVTEYRIYFTILSTTDPLLYPGNYVIFPVYQGEVLVVESGTKVELIQE